MKRRRLHTHLEAEILALFAEGRTPAEVAMLYPGVPRANVYFWYHREEKKKRLATDNNSPTGGSNSEGVANNVPKLSVLPASDDGIGWGLRKCKDIIESTRLTDPRVAVAAINAYFKGLELLRTEPAPPTVDDYDGLAEELEEFFKSRGIQPQSESA